MMERLAGVTWKSKCLATFAAMSPAIEARLGPPTAFGVDSNGTGVFDPTALRFPCGLEVVLWCFHCDRELRPTDPATVPAWYEVYANEPDLAHVGHHLGLALAGEGAPAPPRVAVMRTDDNGIEVELARVSSRCEAEAMVRAYEARGHKQLYWIRAVSSDTRR